MTTPVTPDAFRIFPSDIAVFLLFVIVVIAVGLIKSRGEQGKDDYFLAGRGLKWWLIGFSLIAANISTEQFVGMSGNAASHVGLAIASYEWMAAIALVVIAFGFLPKFLRAGIYTMPEFLEFRFSSGARTVMAVFTVLIYVLLFGAVTYSGALTIATLALPAGYPISIASASLVIGLIAMIYVTVGGLKACAWADLVQGSALIIGGGVIMFFAFKKLGAATEATIFTDPATGAVAVQALDPHQGPVARFFELNGSRLNMILPASDAVFPWTALLFGAWIGHFYYWGLNQYITQRTLGSASLAEGQKGIVFAAFMKLIIPFVIVVPGIIAFNLYAPQMRLAAADHTAVTVATYLKANPATRFVTIAANRQAAVATGEASGHYVLVLEDHAATPAASTESFLLPLPAEKFAALTVRPFIVFVSEDHAWKQLHPGLAEEIETYNREITRRAAAAGQDVVTEKFVAYKYDTALAQLLAHVLPTGTGLIGFVLAALLGAVVSSLAAILNAAATIFTIDIFQRHFVPQASSRTIVRVGRISTVAFTIAAVLLAPQLGNPRISNSIFMIIQESEGFISPGILAVFLFGLVVRRAPPACGIAGLLTNVISCGVLKFAAPSLQFLNRMGVGFGLSLAVMTIITLLAPLRQPVEFGRSSSIALESSRGARYAGYAVIVLTVTLYVIFSRWGIAR